MRGRLLDHYLSLGYFRMHQDLFTCWYTDFGNKFSTVYWLRIALSRVSLEKKQRTLLRKSAQFSVEVNPFALTEEVEALYARYRAAIDFDAPETVEACLFAGSTDDFFNTWSVQLRDKGELVAVGIFDQGANCIAGIMNFYHPDYARYSPGKMLMLLKLAYARSQSFAYYYPGYLATEHPKLNYKLFACEAATEVYDALGREWHPFSWEQVALMEEQWKRS